LRKFRIKAKSKVLILFIVPIGMIMIAGNISLAVNKDAIDKKVAGQLNHKITVGPIFYVFPNHIILKNIKIEKPVSSLGRSSFAITKVGLRFSFWKFLFGGILHITDMTLYSSEVSYYALSQFLEDNIQNILAIIRNSSGNDIKIRIREIQMDFDRVGNPDYIVMEHLLVIRGDMVEGAGLFRTEQYRLPVGNGGTTQRNVNGWPLLYKLKGHLKPDGLEIDQLILKSGNYYSKLWGRAFGGSLKVNGFMFMDTTKHISSESVNSFSHYFKNFSSDNEMSNVDVYVLDIDGKMTFSFPDINIEHFHFDLNNIPVTLKGHISLLDPVLLDADLTLRHPYPKSGKDVFFEKADVHLTGIWKDNVLDTNGHMIVYFVKHGDLSFLPDKTRVTFKGLKFQFDQYKNVSAHLTNGEVAYWTNENEHKITIQNFKTVMNSGAGGLKIIELDAPFYDGLLSGKIFFDLTQTPSKITSRAVLNNVDTDAMEELLIHFAKFNGRMSSTINFTNIPQMDLSGGITIYDGQMTDFNFFNWVSDSFHLPALKAVDFKRATAQFSINEEHVRLYDIHLKTDDVLIAGYFDVNRHNLVTSKLTIALSRGLLSQSSKFRPILKIFEDEHEHLIFDFQLSGNVDAINFQWLPSDVKQKIQMRIPDFIERKIEKDIDKLMEPDP